MILIGMWYLRNGMKAIVDKDLETMSSGRILDTDRPHIWDNKTGDSITDSEFDLIKKEPEQDSY